jgi:hypothetical protein
MGLLIHLAYPLTIIKYANYITDSQHSSHQTFILTLYIKLYIYPKINTPPSLPFLHLF